MATSMASPVGGAHPTLQPAQSAWRPSISPPIQSPGVFSPGIGAPHLQGAKPSPTGQHTPVPLPQQVSTHHAPSVSYPINGGHFNPSANPMQGLQRHPSQELPNMPRQSATPAGQARSHPPSAAVPVPAPPAPLQDQAGTQQYRDITNVIKSADPSILRQALRDNWERCFVGSDYHIAFVLNGTLHQASPAILSRSVQEFGKNLVQASIPQILDHCHQGNFDQNTDRVLSKLSPDFLDKALARRLETIEARSLVNALARAERLGYDVSDIVIEKAPGKSEQVIPSLQGVLPPDFHSQNFTHFSQPPHQQGPAHFQTPHQQGHPVAPPKAQSKDDRSWMAGLPPVPHVGPGAILYCSDCRRPCSGEKALVYHKKKMACDPNFRFDKLGQSICPHCGITFTSNTGVTYHLKVGVCGQYDEETNKIMAAELKKFVDLRESRRAAMAAQPAPRIVPQAPQRQHSQHSGPSIKPQVAQLANQFTTFPANSQPTPKTQTPNKTHNKDADIYAHLNPSVLQRYHEDVARTEEKYGALMRQALAKPEPNRTEEMNKLKNCYNTKQSTTRKRYGIKLREKRTQEEIDSERRRLLGDNGPEQWMEMERAAKRPRTDGGSSSQAGTPSRGPDLAPQPPQTDTPRKRVALADMGGLAGSVGSAETTDPTAFLTSSQPRGLTQLQQARPEALQMSRGASQEGPMTITEDSHSEGQAQSRSQSRGSNSSESEDSDSDDEDIPA